MPANQSLTGRTLNRPLAVYTVTASMLLLGAGIVSSIFIPWERQLLEFLQPFGDTGPGMILVEGAKYLGNGFYQAIPLAIILFYARKQHNKVLFRQIAATLYALIASGILANILKFVVGKARPGENLENWFVNPFAMPNDFHSFPSGHTATSFAVAYVLSRFYPRFAPLFFGIAMLIGIGRVVGESHFPSDVMAGALLGLATGWTTVNPTIAQSRLK